MKKTKIILSCEHATNHIPAQYLYLFQNNPNILNTHEAYDIGSNEITDELYKTLNCKLVKATTSRLLIDCNRKLSHPEVFSKFTKCFSNEEKQNLIQDFYLPFRTEVEEYINTQIQNNYQILHLSIHSFTPKLRDKIRKADIGLLYDSNCHGEKEVCRVLRYLILNANYKYTVRMNYPYNGKSDGFPSFLRKKHTQQDYLGIEIECNQKLIDDAQEFKKLQKALTSAIKELKDYL